MASLRVVLQPTFEIACAGAVVMERCFIGQRNLVTTVVATYGVF